MKRVMLAAMVCAAVLMTGATSASAAIDRTVYRCEGTGTWQVDINLAGQSTAQRSIVAPDGACTKIHAGVEDDGNFSIDSFNTGDSAGPGSTINLIGTATTGVNAFIGVSTGGPTILKGPIAIVGDSLNATLSAADATPWTVTEIHTGDGSCGEGCYRTKAVWIGTYNG
jgi:hypothetical protein